jgi:hypothetical protein
MAIGKQIQISVDDGPLNKLRQQTEQIGRNMIRQSREFTTSGDEAVGYIEHQIRLMERRNKIQEEYARNQLNQQRQAGQITPQQLAQGTRGIETTAGEGRLQIQLLRELIDTVRQTSRDEIRVDREGTERRIRQSRTVGQLAPGGDPTRNLIDTLQSDILQTEGGQAGQAQQDLITKPYDRRQRVKRRVEQTLNKIAGAENEYSLLTSAFEGIPIVGPAMAIASARGIEGAQSFEDAAIRLGRQERFRGLKSHGTTPLSYGRSFGKSNAAAFQRMGLTPSEGMNVFTDMQGAMQRLLGVGEVTNLMGAQRTLGLDANTIQQLLTTSRYDRSTNDPSRIIGQFDKYLRESGKMVTMIPELVGTFTNAASQILATRGEVDTQSLAGVITNMQRRTGFQGGRLDRLTGAYGQLGRTSNPVTRALLMQAFRETDPNASFVDIQERLEGGMSAESRPGLQRFFEIMRERTGGGDALTLALQTALPQLSIKDIRDVVKSGGFAKALQSEQIGDRIDYEAAAPAFVGPVEKSSKEIATTLELLGDELVIIIDTIKSKINEALNRLGPGESGTISDEVQAGSPAEKIAAKNANAVLNNPVF